MEAEVMEEEDMEEDMVVTFNLKSDFENFE